MTEEAWQRLTSNLLAMRQDHGVKIEVVKMIKLIKVAEAAELFTQMKGAIGAVVHPAGQIWLYKFVHALLRIILQTGNLNLQANTPAERVSERDVDGWITVETARGNVKTRAVVHATNQWAAHLLPEFEKLIYPGLATVAAMKALEGLMKHTGVAHWDSNINVCLAQNLPRNGY
jgi:glycine/D-amino acid oxidase-like deaminating enzyme